MVLRGYFGGPGGVSQGVSRRSKKPDFPRPENSQISPNFAKFHQILPNFTKICQKLQKIAKNRQKSSKIDKKSPKFAKICQNLTKFSKFVQFRTAKKTRFFRPFAGLLWCFWPSGPKTRNYTIYTNCANLCNFVQKKNVLSALTLGGPTKRSTLLCFFGYSTPGGGGGARFQDENESRQSCHL